jgi:hypothetical protein
MKKLGILLFVLALIAAVAFLLLHRRYGLQSAARKEWKREALAEISRWTANTNGVNAELAQLKRAAAQNPDGEGSWIADHLLLMKNGEWIAYRNHCQKSDARIHDIFLGRGSDGKWYYSTFHFCIAMVSLRMEDQPATLADFVRACFLREFDGHSDECLQLTWPSPARDQPSPNAS